MNSGRLSVASTLHSSPLNTVDVCDFSGAMVPGAAAADAPVETDGLPAWLLRHLHDSHGATFSALLFAPADAESALRELNAAALGIAALQVLVIVPATSRAALSGVDGARVLVDAQGLARQRYDARDGTLVLLRPDQHVCARWRSVQPQALSAALRRALALT